MFAVLHAVPWISRSTGFWGLDAFGYLSWPLTILVLAGGGLLAWQASRSSNFPRFTPANLVAFVALTGVGLWALRSSTLLYGDGLPIVSSLVRRDPLPPNEPLAAAVPRIFDDMLATVDPSLDRIHRAWTSVAAVSALAGLLYVAGCWVLVHELALHRGRPPRAVTLALFISQGYVLVFFGHVEYYSLPMAMVPLFIAASLRYLRTSSTRAFASAGIALGLATVLHLASLVLWPALLALPFLTGRSLRRIAVHALSGVALPVVALAAASRVAGHAGVLDSFGTLLGASRSIQEAVHPRASLGDWLNGQIFVGPLSAPVALLTLLAGFPRSRLSRFAFVLAASPIAAGLLATQSNLGYARNWDLLALFAPAITAAILVRCTEGGETAVWWAAMRAGLAASFIHTASWVLVMADEPTSLRRFAALPLGAGQAASTIGFWHALRGRPEEARTWLERSIRTNHDNVRAQLALGRLQDQAGDHAAAFHRFATAARMRPDLYAPAAGAALAALDAGTPARAESLLYDLASRNPEARAPREILRALQTIESASRTRASSPEAAESRAALMRYRDR